jgi:NAD(P)-dependent dehydrogenase (short-subunit alcohol dehydrogenase family)
MPTLAAAKASNATYSPSYIPTAVFIGGTSGIGRAMAEFYAKQTNGRANIILIGRDRVVGESIIASFPTPPSTDPITGSNINVTHEFIQCDASLIKNVETTSKELLAKLSKINILVLSFTKLTFSRADTAEGNDISMATRYLARAKFVEELMPLLEKAKEMGEDARMESILGSPSASPVDLNDLDARNVSVMKLSANTGSYNDVMVKVSFISFSAIIPYFFIHFDMYSDYWFSPVTDGKQTPPFY